MSSSEKFLIILLRSSEINIIPGSLSYMTQFVICFWIFMGHRESTHTISELLGRNICDETHNKKNYPNNFHLLYAP